MRSTYQQSDFIKTEHRCLLVFQLSRPSSTGPHSRAPVLFDSCIAHRSPLTLFCASASLLWRACRGKKKKGGGMYVPGVCHLCGWPSALYRCHFCSEQQSLSSLTIIREGTRCHVTSLAIESPLSAAISQLRPRIKRSHTWQPVCCAVCCWQDKAMTMKKKCTSREAHNNNLLCSVEKLGAWCTQTQNVQYDSAKAWRDIGAFCSVLLESEYMKRLLAIEKQPKPDFSEDFSPKKTLHLTELILKDTF